MGNEPNKFDFTESINRLEEINSWFQSEEIDLDEGLKKFREGKDLIKKCRKRLAEVENEFVKINDELTEEEVVNHTIKEEFSEKQPLLNKASDRYTDPDDVQF